MRYPLKDKVVFLTGASSGLGKALAFEMARAGAKLALASRNQAKLEEVATECRRLGSGLVKVYNLDVSRASDAARVLKAASQDFGTLDVLVNNAGVHALALVADMPEGMVHEAMEVNFFGPLRLIQGALPALRLSKGMVVNIGSTLSFRSIPTGGAYSATKGALARLSESLRDEEAKNGVHVLHACPGVVFTQLRAHALSHNVTPTAQDKLPFPRSPEVTAREIVSAIQSKRRELLSAAWIVRFWVRVIVPWFGGFLDARMKL